MNCFQIYISPAPPIENKNKKKMFKDKICHWYLSYEIKSLCAPALERARGGKSNGLVGFADIRFADFRPIGQRLTLVDCR